MTNIKFAQNNSGKHIITKDNKQIVIDFANMTKSELSEVLGGMGNMLKAAACYLSILKED